MKELVKYSYVNARIRAMKSYLLGPELWERLLEARDLSDALEVLRETAYKDIADKFEEGRSDLIALETEFLKKDLDTYHKIYSSLSTKNEQTLVFLLIQKYELEELKTVLRIWCKKSHADIQEYLIGRKIAFDIDFKKIMTVSSLEEIIILLGDTPYKVPLSKERERFKQKCSVFFLETALDADYYARLLGCVEKLSATDQVIARRILGITVDIANISWLIRARGYYKLDTADILGLVIPGGQKINKEAVRRAASGSEGTAALLETVAVGPYAQMKNFSAANVSLLERFLNEILLREVKKLLTGYPFTIGTVLGFFILKQTETRNIISLLYAKNIGMKKEETSSLTGV